MSIHLITYSQFYVVFSVHDYHTLPCICRLVLFVARLLTRIRTVIHQFFIISHLSFYDLIFSVARSLSGDALFIHVCYECVVFRGKGADWGGGA